MRIRGAFAATLLGLLVALPGVLDREAHAAGTATGSASTGTTSGIALDQFDPAPAGDAFFGVPSPFARGSWVPRAILLFDYASQPLKLSQQGEMPSMVVSRQAFLHVDASLSIQDRLLISVLVPVAVVQGGDSPSVSSDTLTSPTAAQIGDVRVGLRVRMVGDDDDPFQLGLSGNLYVPTSPMGSFAGEGYVRAEPELLAGGRFRAGVTWIYSAYGGFMVRRTENPTDVVYGGGIAASLWADRLQLGAEAYASTPIQNSQFTLTPSLSIPVDNATNAEILFGARVRMYRDLIAGWAVGPGLTTALGTPQVRFVGSIGWAPGLPRAAQTEADSDGDGIPDAIDACPYAFGPRSADPKKNGCPVLDDDEDGIPNDEDACPDKWGVRSADPKKNGCPPETVVPPGETPNAPAPPPR